MDALRRIPGPRDATRAAEISLAKVGILGASMIAGVGGYIILRTSKAAAES